MNYEGIISYTVAKFGSKMTIQADITKEWQAANTARSALYRWFADIFARELTTATLNDWQHNQAYEGVHEAFVSLGLEQYSTRVKTAITDLEKLPKNEQALELAADFAQLFLLSGDDSAPPYASYYLSDDKHLYGEPTQQMRSFLESQQLSLHPEFREPDDHLSVYFMVMSLWIDSSLAQRQEMMSSAEQQLSFLQNALLNWLPKFNARCQQIKVQTDFYPALIALAEQFVLADSEALASVIDEG